MVAAVRGDFIHGQAGGNRDLEQAVFDLLKSADEAEQQGFLETPVAANLRSAGDSESHGDGMIGHQVGPYRLLSVLGEGGFGTVYLAQQTEPVSRQVALKVIRADLPSRGLVSRFDAERRTLALLNHPNIAQVFDAGAGPAGMPFLVMEYIDGMPITTYCQERQLEIREILRLFARVCDAIQHAHQKGVIHRDIKPANVLVIQRQDGPQPKVIDFGIAKVLDLKVNEQTLATGTGFIGSPSYMSPEQIEGTGIDIDTRSDVYGLGVLLYELLTGAAPFVAEGESVVVLLNKILEQEPVRPSRQAESLSLGSDLDWVILKALAKNRDQRYPSAAAFAADVRRFLDDQPVEARAPTFSYRAAKFVRRHTVGVAASALILISLVGGVIGTGFGLLNARKEAANALEQTRNAEQTVDLLLEFLTSADPREQGRELKVVQLLEAFKPRLDTLGDRPAIQASLMHAYAETYAGLGLYGEAMEFADGAANLRAAELGPTAPATLDSRMLHADALRETADYEQAERISRATLEQAAATLGDNHPLTLDAATRVAWVLEKVGRYGDAETLLRATLEKRQAAHGVGHPETLDTMSRLATTLWRLNKMDEAEEYARSVVSGSRELLGAEHPDTLVAMNELAVIISEGGRLEEGEQLHRQTMALRQKVLGPDHPRTITSMANLAWVQGELGRFAESEALTREAWKIEVALLGPSHPNVLTTQLNLAGAVERLGRLEDAETLRRETLARMNEVLGPEHPASMTGLNDLAVGLVKQGQLEQARDVFSDLSSLRREVNGPDHPGTLTTLGNLAVVNSRLGEHSSAETALREVIASKERSMGAEHPSTLRSKSSLVGNLVLQDDARAAEEIIQQVLEVQKRTLGAEHPDTLMSVLRLGDVRELQGRADEAERLYRQSLEGHSQALGPDHPLVARIQKKLNSLLSEADG